MTINALVSVQSLAAEPQARLAGYVPKVLSADQWAAVREDVVDLVARCGPRTGLEAAVLCSSLCRLLAAFAGEVDELRVEAALTPLNVARLIERYGRDGMADGTRHQHRARLHRLLKAQAGVPATYVARPSAPRDLHPYTRQEIDALGAAAGNASGRVRQVVISAVVLGVAHGLVLPEAEAVSRDASGVLRHGTGLLHGAGALDDPFDRAVVGGFTKADWERARTWLKAHADVPVLLTKRLRDTWLLRTQAARPAPTPVRLMAQGGVGRPAVEAVAAHQPPAQGDALGDLLRDF